MKRTSFFWGLAMGAPAGIGGFYNVILKQVVGIYEAANAGDLETGRKLQSALNQVIRFGLTYGGIQSLRAILKWQGFEVGDPILPTRPMGKEAMRNLRSEIESAELGII